MVPDRTMDGLKNENNRNPDDTDLGRGCGQRVIKWSSEQHVIGFGFKLHGVTSNVKACCQKQRLRFHQ